MRTNARRDRVMYPGRSTPFARDYLYLNKVFAFYFDHTLGTLFSQHNITTSTRVTQVRKQTLDEDVTLLFESLGGVVLHAEKV